MSDHTHDDHDQHMNGGEPSPEQRDAMHGDMSHAGDHDVEPTYDAAGAALGALSPEEEAEVLAAAEADPVLAAELAQLSDVAAELARLAPTHAINRGRSAGMRSRLLARAAATHVGRRTRVPSPTEAERTQARDNARAAQRTARPATPAPSPQPAHHAPPRSTGTHRAVPYEAPSWSGSGHVLRWMGIAALLVVGVVGVYAVNRIKVTRDDAASTVAARDSVLNGELAAARAELARKDSIIGALTGMHTRVIDLVGYQSLEPMARMFWDQQTQQWTMYASHLKRPPTGKTYQLWLIAKGHPEPISAGTFMPDQGGSAVMTAKYALEPGALRRIAVTEEPDGGVPAPTGPVMFAGVGR